MHAEDPAKTPSGAEETQSELTAGCDERLLESPFIVNNWDMIKTAVPNDPLKKSADAFSSKFAARAQPTEACNAPCTQAHGAWPNT